MSGAVQVALRPLAAGDGARLLAWRNLPEIARWMYSDHVIGAEEHDRWLVGALDHRGHGVSGGRRAAVERFDDWITDLDGYISEVLLDAPRPLFLLGHSLGVHRSHGRLLPQRVAEHDLRGATAEPRPLGMRVERTRVVDPVAAARQLARDPPDLLD